MARNLEDWEVRLLLEESRLLPRHLEEAPGAIEVLERIGASRLEDAAITQVLDMVALGQSHGIPLSEQDERAVMTGDPLGSRLAALKACLSAYSGLQGRHEGRKGGAGLELLRAAIAVLATRALTDYMQAEPRHSDHSHA